MASRRFNFRKFIYTDDFNLSTVKVQREFKFAGTDTPIVPITTLFQTRLLEIPEKAETNFNGEELRHVLAFANTEDNKIGQFKQFVPFAPSDPALKQHIGEIVNLTQVICGDYRGESSGFTPRLNNTIINQT